MQPIDADEITRGLWMGSAPPYGRSLARAGFHVLALCAEEFQPSPEHYPSISIFRASLIDDGTPLSKAQVDEVLETADRLASALRSGRTALVTCVQGRNRSGLVCAVTLARVTGMSGQEAERAVRRGRNSPFGPALTNKEYCKALRLVPGRYAA